MFVRRRCVAWKMFGVAACLFVLGLPHLLPAVVLGGDSRPNILFCISDDQSWLHAGAMGDPVVKTPAFDPIVRRDILDHYFEVQRFDRLVGDAIAYLEDVGELDNTLDDYLLSGFESRPGRHPWQGEHVGKWLHAATLAFEHTGDERYLTTVQNAWHDIKTQHLDVTGGPWGRHMTYNGNRECFALMSDYDPAEVDVETCSTTTWVQLNLHLLEVTGQAKYAVEAERATLNAIMAAQHRNGLDWCYYIRANQNRRPYERAIKCCSSSGPRALEMFVHYLVGEVNGGVSLTSLVPCTAVLPESLGGTRIKVMGNYPFKRYFTMTSRKK